MNARAILTACGSALALGALLVPTATASSAKYRTHTEAARQFERAGITWVSSGHCSDRNRRSCTSFAGINRTTVSGVIAFKRASRCAVTITGGTETGHAMGTYSHGGGYKVDLNPTACVSRYITEHFRYAGKRGGDHARMYKSPAGNVYSRERSHWDVLYLNGNS